MVLQLKICCNNFHKRTACFSYETKSFCQIPDVYILSVYQVVLLLGTMNLVHFHILYWYILNLTLGNISILEVITPYYPGRLFLYIILHKKEYKM